MSAVIDPDEKTGNRDLLARIAAEQADAGAGLPLEDGVVYSRRRSCCRFATPSVAEYTKIIGQQRTERLLKAAEHLKGAKLLELNATAQGGGVAEMLYSSVPFIDSLGIQAEWKVIRFGTPPASGTRYRS